MQIKFKKLCNDAIIPEYQTAGSAGMDIRTIESYKLIPGERKIFQTGLAVAVEDGYEVQVRARSGLSAKCGVTVINGQGWYSKEDVKVITVVARKNESTQIFRLIKEIDPNAFISQSAAIGVYGKGFEN
jgi:deoxyuridine 5'-triphosphate nucleotidohydrolase